MFGTREEACVEEDLSVTTKLRMRCVRGFNHNGFFFFANGIRRLVNRYKKKYIKKRRYCGGRVPAANASRRLTLQTLVFSRSYLHRQVSLPEILVVKGGKLGQEIAD